MERQLEQRDGDVASLQREVAAQEMGAAAREEQVEGMLVHVFSIFRSDSHSIRYLWLQARSLRQELQEAKATALQRYLDMSSSAASDREQETVALHAKIAQLNQAIAALEAEKTAVAQEAADARRELMEAKAAHRLCTDKIASMDAALSSRERELTDAKLELHEHSKCRGKLAALERQGEMARETNSKYSEVLGTHATCATTIGNLQARVRELSSESAGRRDSCESCAEHERTIARLEADLKIAAHQVEAQRTSRAPDGAEGAAYINRCLRICEVLMERLAGSDLILARRPVARAQLLPTKTTLGMAFDSASFKITRVLIGGPAHSSGLISEGDTLVSIDGVRLRDRGEDVARLLTGSDEPGSACVVVVKKGKSSETQSASLLRVDNAILAHKRQMFDSLCKLQAQVERQGAEAEGVRLVEAVMQLWSQTMTEQNEHDTACAASIGELQKEGKQQLEELQSLLHRLLQAQERLSKSAA